MTEQEQHEMAVIDAVVRGAATSEPEDAALTTFALRMRTARPSVNDGFARELDELLEQQASPKGRPRSVRNRALMGASAGSLLAVIAAIVVVNPFGSTSSLTSSGGDSAGPPGISETRNSAPGANTVARPATEDLGDYTRTPANGEMRAKMQSAAPTTVPGRPRKVERGARLTLATPPDNVENVADDITGVVDESGGFVEHSQVTARDGGGSARFTLRIPTPKYQTTLAELSKLAHVRSRTQSVQDITAGYTASQRAASIALSRLRRATDRYTAAEPGSREAAVLKLQMHRAERAYAARRAQLNRFRARANFSTMSVRVVGDASAPDDQGAIAHAWDVSKDVLTVTAAVLLVALTVLTPIAIVCLAAWFAFRRIRRSRRDAAIDAAAS